MVYAVPDVTTKFKPDNTAIDIRHAFEVMEVCVLTRIIITRTGEGIESGNDGRCKVLISNVR